MKYSCIVFIHISVSSNKRQWNKTGLGFDVVQKSSTRWQTTTKLQRQSVYLCEKGTAGSSGLWKNANFQTIKIHILWHCWGKGDADFSRELKVMLSWWTRRDGWKTAAAFLRQWRKEATWSRVFKCSNPIYEWSSFISFCLKHLDGRDGHHWVKTISTVYLKIWVCVRAERTRKRPAQRTKVTCSSSTQCLQRRQPAVQS